MKKITGALAATVLAMTMSSCVAVEGDFKVSEDGRLDGTLRQTVDVAAMMEMSMNFGEEGDTPAPEPTQEEVDEAVAEFVGDLDAIKAELPDSITAEEVDDDGWAGAEFTLDGATFAEFNDMLSNVGDSEGTGVTTTSADDEMTWTVKDSVGTLAMGSTPMDQGEDTEESLQMAAMMGVKLQMTFAFDGTVTESTGKISEDGDAVTFDMLKLGDEPLEATVELGGGTNWLLIGGGIGALVLLGAALLLLLRRRTPTAGPAAQPAQPEPYQAPEGPNPLLKDL